jgi:hypothetical protein
MRNAVRFCIVRRNRQFCIRTGREVPTRAERERERAAVVRASSTVYFPLTGCRSSVRSSKTPLPRSGRWDAAAEQIVSPTTFLPNTCEKFFEPAPASLPGTELVEQPRRARGREALAGGALRSSMARPAMVSIATSISRQPGKESCLGQAVLILSSPSPRSGQSLAATPARPSRSGPADSRSARH